MEKMKLLVVDDTNQNLKILVELLGFDYDISVANEASKAIKILEEKTVDLILLDIIMPNINGFELCEILKSNNKTKDIPILFITAKTDEQSIIEAFNAGGVDYITKPFKPRELQARIKTHLNLIQLKKKEIQYKKNQALIDLVSNISHHWRQPLSSLNTSAEEIKLSLFLDEDITEKRLHEHCDMVHEQVNFLSNTISNLQSTICSNKTLSKINFNSVVDTFIYEIKKSLEKYNINVITNIDKNLTIYSNKDILINIFKIIFNNSLDAFIINKEITKKYFFIDISNKNKTTCITLKDNAKGIDESILPKIFDPYSTTKHKSQGVGLSLNTAYNIIENQLKGNIEIYNDIYAYEGKKYKGAKAIIIF